MKVKKLKIWNGRGDYHTYDHFYVAAYTQKQAVELINKFAYIEISTYELKKYYAHGCWGTSMKDIEPDVGLWATLINDKWGKPIRLI